MLIILVITVVFLSSYINGPARHAGYNCSGSETGSGNPTGTALGTNTTDVLGYYRFDGLVAGTYVVVVDTVTSGTALGGLASSTGWDTGLTTADGQMDHGIDVALGAGSVLPGGIASVPVAGLPAASV